MYTKLAFRNAKRSAGDYLLYITTLVILSALMMFSNALSEASNQNGLQAGSIPAMIALAMVALLYYINGYMLSRRAKEFATYILLGMKKGRMAFIFFGESFILGMAGLVAGILLGMLVFALMSSMIGTLFTVKNGMPQTYALAALYTVCYFVVIQAASLLGCVHKIKTMQLGSLLLEKRKNQALKSKPRPAWWTSICVFCIFAVIILLTLITSGNAALMLISANMLVFPLVLAVWAFYKAAFHWLAWLRTNRRSALYKGNRLYFAAQILSKVTSNIMLNTVLSVCLIFSAMAFSAGFIVPNIPGGLFEKSAALWMSFAEICMCLVFMAIYFTILAVHQIIEVKENSRAFQIMSFLGKNKRQNKFIIKGEIVFKHSFPAVMYLLLMPILIGITNGFFNALLPPDNLLLISSGFFAGCFMLFYMGYSFVVYKMSVKHI